MPSSSSLALGGAVAAAAIVAALRSPPSRPISSAFDEPPTETVGLDDVVMPEQANGELPPNHPPIDSPDLALEPGEPEPEPDDQGAALTWKAPPSWKVMPNPNSMRLATYRIPRAAGASDDAELSVVRAGGSTEANFARWIEQFTDADAAKRSQKTVRGLTIAVLEVGGTFTAGGMGPSVAAAPKPGWRLKGAVVETPQGSYFFKLTGPSASVRAAQRDFDALLESIDSAESNAL